VLDIGCGVAGIDVFLYRHYAGRAPRLFLLDRSRIEASLSYGFKPDQEFYNSLPVARELLLANGVGADDIVLVEATERNEIRVDTQVDLIVSLRSWGFHYPVDAYLDEAVRVLAPRGTVILDVRRDTGGLAMLRGRFADVQAIAEREKFQRIRCTGAR
jgi:SAM-dependent methyltransferase